MLVSIVIPAYNAVKYLAQTVDSVLAQTLTHWELILVDDGSADDTLALAERYAQTDPRIHAVHQANGGVASARNCGYNATNPKSRYVIFLDSDDVWLPEALQILSAVLDANQNFVAAYGLARMIDKDGNALPSDQMVEHQRRRRGISGRRLVEFPVEAPTTFAMLAFWNYIITPGTIMMRRSALERVMPFDCAAVPAEDLDLWIRISRLGDIALVNQAVLNYRSHDANASKQRHKMNRGNRYVRQKLLRCADLTQDERLIARTSAMIDGYVFVGYAKSSLLRGQPVEAVKNLFRAGIRFATYVKSIYT